MRTPSPPRDDAPCTRPGCSGHTNWQHEEMDRSGPRCETCNDTGQVPAPYGGNCEIMLACPDCTEPYRP